MKTTIDVKKVIPLALGGISVLAAALQISLVALCIIASGFVMLAQKTPPTITCKNFLLILIEACSQIINLLSSLDTKVLAITGYDGGRLADTEVLDLLNPDLKCQNLAPFAMGKSSATGALVKGSVVVCGGSYYGSLDQCHTVSKSNFTFLTYMDTRRSNAASIAIKNTLWALGGSGGGSTSTEYVGMNMSSEPIPSENDWNCKNGKQITLSKVCDGQQDCDEGEDEEHCMMPLPLMGHTILEIEPYVYMLIGGESSGFSGKTFIKKAYQNWTPGPNLTEARHSHTAGLITDQITLKKSVVVFGGGTPFNTGNQILNSVEMLSLPIEDNSMWQPGNTEFSLIVLTVDNPFDL